MFSLAFPIFLQLVINSVINSVTTAMLSNFDPAIITANNVVGQIVGVLVNISMMGCTGMGILLSQALGKNNREIIDNILINSIFLSVVVYAAVALVGILMQDVMFGWFNISGRALEYARVIFIGSIIANALGILVTAYSTVLRCYGKMAWVVGITIGRIALSAAHLAIFLYTPLSKNIDIPIMLAANSVWITLLGAIVTYIVYKKYKIYTGYKLNRRIMTKTLFIGVPGLISQLSYTISTFITTIIIANISVEYINIKVYCNSILMYIYMLGYSVANGSSLMIGRLMGAGEYERIKRMKHCHILVTCALNLFFAVIVFLFREPLYGIFDHNPDHLSVVLPVFALDIAVEVARGMNNSSQFALNAVGDVMFTTIISIISCWLNAVLLSYVFAVACGLGLVGLWIAFICDEWFRAIMYEIRWHSGKWARQII